MDSKNKEASYRTRWLMAHNRLHGLTHDIELIELKIVNEQWGEYLADVARADEVSSVPA